MEKKFKKKFVKVPDESINILLLGESGVGKSTFINSLSNYFYHATLEDALNGELMSLIPSQFVLTDKDLNVTHIKVGNVINEIIQNESFEIGKAQTVNAKAHSIKMGNKVITFIDTPGIGDPAGPTKDKENIENTIQFLSNYQIVQGFCILLKPNNARLDLHFRYCFKELLLHLHKKCAPNIVFCFTNARATFYEPGDSFLPLKILLEEIEKESGVAIPLEEKNVFCFDNEAFRYLAAYKQGASFTDKQKNDFNSSWEASSKSASQMISYITELPLQEVSTTIQLNKARTILKELSKPIAELSQNIETNKKLALDKIKELESLDCDPDYLMEKLYISQIDYETVELGYPRTVCTDRSCCEVINVGSVTKYNYKTHCHIKCHLKGVAKEVLSNPALLKCRAMDKHGNCKKCMHTYDKHMHVTYENKLKTVKVIDENIKLMVDNKEDSKKTVEAAIKSINETIEQHILEQQEIIKISAKFAAFSKHHALLTFNNDLENYTNLMIQEEQSKSQITGADNKAILEGLEEFKKSYNEQKKLFEDLLKEGKDDQICDSTNIEDLLEELYNLPLNGEKLKNSIEIIKKINLT